MPQVAAFHRELPFCANAHAPGADELQQRQKSGHVGAAAFVFAEQLPMRCSVPRSIPRSTCITRLPTETNGAVTSGSKRSWLGFLRRRLRPIRLYQACTRRSGSCGRVYSAGLSSGIGVRTAVYRSRARPPSSAATRLQVLYSIRRPVSSAFMRSASWLRGSSSALFICTRWAAMSINSLDTSMRSCIDAIAAVYWSISSMMLMS